MQFPISTGQAATLLGVTEPQLAEAVRRGKVRPAPKVIAGRRLWWPSHVVQVAEALNLSTGGLPKPDAQPAPAGEREQ